MKEIVDAKEGAEWLLNNRILIHPTDGIWGLGCIATRAAITKIDKLKQNGNPKEGVEFKIEEYKKVLLENWEFLPKIFFSSFVKHIGKENIIGYINNLNQSISQK